MFRIRANEIGWEGSALDRGLLMESELGFRVGEVWHIGIKTQRGP